MKHGTCGTCAWELYQGTLVIAPENGKEGILAEPDDLPVNEWPWREYAGTIKEVLIADGVRAGRSAAGLFRYMEMCSGFEIERLDVSGTEDMSCMFDGCSGLEDLSPVSGWNTANVRYMCGMFEDCDALCSTSPLKGWNTGKVEDMSDMFCMCSSLKDLSGLAGWDTGNVTNMSYMFAKCFSLSDISPLAGWDTKNVAQTDYMFYVCSALDDISPLAGWNTGNVQIMTHMFVLTKTADTSPLRGWNVKNVRDMSFAFSGCRSLSDLSGLAGWDTGNAVHMEGMFDGCILLNDLSGLAGWDTKNVVSMSMMFCECLMIQDISALSRWNTGKVKTMNGMFRKCRSVSDISVLSGWNTENAEEMNEMFMECGISDGSVIKLWDTGSVKTFRSIFGRTRIPAEQMREIIPMACPKEGAFIGYKKCRNDDIVELLIPENAQRSSGYGRKCRCDRAEVVRIMNRHGLEVQRAVSMRDAHLTYRKGGTVRVQNFDKNRFNECAAGIHFFMTKEEAESY